MKCGKTPGQDGITCVHLNFSVTPYCLAYEQSYSVSRLLTVTGCGRVGEAFDSLTRTAIPQPAAKKVLRWRLRATVDRKTQTAAVPPTPTTPLQSAQTSRVSLTSARPADSQDRLVSQIVGSHETLATVASPNTSVTELRPEVRYSVVEVRGLGRSEPRFDLGPPCHAVSHTCSIYLFIYYKIVH